jgi:hypothetical protein
MNKFIFVELLSLVFLIAWAIFAFFAVAFGFGGSIFFLIVLISPIIVIGIRELYYIKNDSQIMKYSYDYYKKSQKK